MNLEQRFARIATELAVRSPRLWRLLRRPLRRQFDRLAPTWDRGRSPNRLAGLEAALELVPSEPARILDVGTGTGDAALALARRWPGAEVVGVDVSEGMVEQARRKLTPELERRVRFDAADAAALPFPDRSFELVALNNAIPFFDELARVLAPGGYVVVGATAGPDTPIYVPPARWRAELGRRGFDGFRETSAGAATGFLARRGERA